MTKASRKAAAPAAAPARRAPTQRGDPADLKSLDIVGIYPNYKTAYRAWQGKAQGSVDNARMRYYVVHLHRLLEPDVDEQPHADHEHGAP